MLPHLAWCTDVHCVLRGVNPEMGCNSLIVPPTRPSCALYFQCYDRAELVHEYEFVSSRRQHLTQKLWRQAIVAGYLALEAV